MLRTIINGEVVAREAVLAWEDRRTAAVRRKLKLAPSAAPRDQQRRELLDRKLALGHDGLRTLIGRGLWLSDKITH
ncbi:MAG: hypothetical protein JWL96_1012 [Sphingomonas bacterium]|uniref:hypothetical protein n=1 Tax=Sphingomonas bacterium TaxID=1895847 RepID=UPI00261608EA|nr:hypothetical protein [Sphingomonas bacterium]MDB5708942.1 hypothetical protein [Sphingomonas bacterium]